MQAQSKLADIIQDSSLTLFQVQHLTLKASSQIMSGLGNPSQKNVLSAAPFTGCSKPLISLPQALWALLNQLTIGADVSVTLSGCVVTVFSKEDMKTIFDLSISM